MSRPTTTGQQAAICAAYQAGRSTVQIAADTGYSPEAIRQILHRHGIPRRNPSRITDDLRASIAAAYQAGATIRCIAAALHLSYGTTPTGR